MRSSRRDVGRQYLGVLSHSHEDGGIDEDVFRKLAQSNGRYRLGGLVSNVCYQ